MITDNIQHFYCASVYPRTAQTYLYHGHRQFVSDKCAPVNPLTAQTCSYHSHRQLVSDKWAPVNPLTAQTYSYHGHRQLVPDKHAHVNPLGARTFSPLCHGLRHFAPAPYRCAPVGPLTAHFHLHTMATDNLHLHHIILH